MNEQQTDQQWVESMREGNLRRAAGLPMMGPSYQYKAKMGRVIDGDTYEIDIDLGFRISRTEHLRLRNFNTAELRSSNPVEVAHAKEARDFVAALLPAGTAIVITSGKTAIYNRWEADVWFMIGGIQISLADVLAAEGYARKDSYLAGNPM